MSALSRIIRRRGIPEPTMEVQALYETVAALKEVVETLTRQRGEQAHSAVTVEDLVELGILDRRPGGKFIKSPS